MSTIAVRTPHNHATRDTVIYWISTAIIAVLMTTTALLFAFDPSQKAAAAHLGVPVWLRNELTVTKLLGSLALVLPATPALIREFTYFGFGLIIVSADVAHLSSGDSTWFILPHAFLLCTLVVSYRLFHRTARRQDAVE